MEILFVDSVSGDYDGHCFHRQANIGGTEITIVAVAELLAAHHRVTVAQHQRSKEAEVNGVRYVAYDHIRSSSQNVKPDAVIVIRRRREVMTVAKRYPQAKLFYWMHDIPSQRLWKYKHKFARCGCELIAISNYQEKIIRQAWKGNAWQRTLDKWVFKAEPTIHVIYNPVQGNLQPDETPVVANKLIFFSAPDRGLGQILSCFAKLRKKMADMQLFIAHPGYSSLDGFKEYFTQPGIEWLGSLAHRDIIRHVREALCVFYPQNQKPECFGLVYAEANAVGTPVLAHDFGAAQEILTEASQLINGNDEHQIWSRLSTWRQQRPQVKLAEKFRPKQVLARWEQVLNNQAKLL